MENWEDENPKNIYVIMRKLATYSMAAGERDWIFEIGHFMLVVRLLSEDYWKVTSHGIDIAALRKIHITDFKGFEVLLYESSSRDPSLRNHVYLNQDPRFKDYQPIQYDVIETPTGGRINQSDGKKMPLLPLMELIRLLYRLSNLTAFL
jgi:hypothetical protein